MSFKNELLGNEDFIASALKSLIEQEFKRVAETGLVSKAECFEFIEKHKKDGLNGLLSIYSAVSNVKLAGDKLEQDKFYDLKDVLNKIKEIKKETPAPNKCSCAPGQCVGTDCPCPSDCKCKNDSLVLKKMESLISNTLEKVAYSLGREGDHNTAYLVERTLKDIKGQLKRGSLIDEDNSEELTERNKILIAEANQLLKEFNTKFPNANYLHFVNAIRAEMRKTKENDPKKAVGMLRTKWNSK